MTGTPHKATPEQLDAALSALQRLCSHVAELRDRVEHLERMHETKKAALLDIYERLDKLKDGHESNWSRIVKLEEAQEGAPTATPAPAGSLLEVVSAVIANGIACDREDDDTASEVIAAVAGWLEQQLGPSFWIRRLRKEAGR